ncbi:unnamed protein product [Lactuca virosa]|uniref:Uncharacterized protein n=1 Tax=Lactuca virosa TaxID=75947 RepID=A0AAU9N8I3_9ASTR|nr:unnamed protein product [Lactuca virosa]
MFQEPSAEEQPKKKKAADVLKFKGKKQYSKPKSNKFKKTIEPVIKEEDEVVKTEYEETDTEVQEPIQDTFYDHRGNVDDVDQMMHDNPSVSPRRDASIKSNIEETNNLDVTVNTDNVEETSRKVKHL